MRRIPIFKNLSFSKMLKVLEIVVSILRKIGRILAIVVVIVAKKMTQFSNFTKVLIFCNCFFLTLVLQDLEIPCQI